MNQQLPKPLQEALARQVGGDVHPLPDVLAAFMERTLAPVENEVVTHHLAQCAECREIVFLASEAAEEEVSDERELVAASGTRLVPVPARAASQIPTPRPRWRLRMMWGVPVAAAALLVAGVLFVQLSRSGTQQNLASLPVAGTRSAPASTQGQQIALSRIPPEPANAPAPEQFAKSTPHGAKAVRSANGPGVTVVGRAAANQQLPSGAELAPMAKGSPEAALTVSGLTQGFTSSMATQNGFAESEAKPASQQPIAEFAKSLAGTHATRTPRAQWRITQDGHLEHSAGAEGWTATLVDPSTSFRAVAAVGNDVWAGGNGGALFHSSDGGEHWRKVSLIANSEVETGAIVTIRFADQQHGMVASDAGTRWATTDGGVTWMTNP